jgi:hypothetical protein
VNSAQATLLALLVLALLPAVLGWLRDHRTWAPLSLVLLAAVGVAAALPVHVATGSRPLVAVVAVLAGALAVVGGGPVTSWVFALADSRDSTSDNPIDRAGQILRGGAWIGALERLGVFVSLAAGLPEGVAVVLAVKALGRYPELRNEDATGIAERFIIGTFSSVLWAVACAAVVRLVVA